MLQRVYLVPQAQDHDVVQQRAVQFDVHQGVHPGQVVDGGDGLAAGVFLGSFPAEAVGQKDVVAVLFLVPLVAVGLIQQVKGFADAAADVPHILALDRVVRGQHREQRPIDVAHGLGSYGVVLAPQLLLGGGLRLLLAEDPLQGRLFLGGLAVGALQGDLLAHPLHLLLEGQLLVAAVLQAVPAHQDLDLGGQADALGLAHHRHPGQAARQADVLAGGLAAGQAVGQQGHHAPLVGQRPIGDDAVVEIHLVLDPAHVAQVDIVIPDRKLRQIGVESACHHGPCLPVCRPIPVGLAERKKHVFSARAAAAALGPGPWRGPTDSSIIYFGPRCNSYLKTLSVCPVNDPAAPLSNAIF